MLKIIKYIKLLAQFIKIAFQQVRFIWKVSELHHPIITIFGGSRLKSDNIYANKAHNLGKNLIDRGISVLTGGGPGVMEAASCGASHGEKGAKTFGITVKGLDKLEEVNPCMDGLITTDYFWARKWLLINYSNGYVFFPGGFGTLDELAEVLTLMQTGNLKFAPVIVIGKEYWEYIEKWSKESGMANGLILPENFDFIKFTDDVDEALKILIDYL
jgi:uncharacterized protein (TIGR00730 family)